MNTYNHPWGRVWGFTRLYIIAILDIMDAVVGILTAFQVNPHWSVRFLIMELDRLQNENHI